MKFSITPHALCRRTFLHTALRLKVIQHGNMQLYLVYVLVTLVGLLFWQMGGVLGA